ncbi:MAG: antitoxin [Nitrospirae bacterium RBG_16_43_11]|nr:MAG: antitoxin [Nitrospirae bacterium RBG_16_43_11]
MPQYNPDKLTKLISEMRKAIVRLKALRSVEKDIFLKDLDKLGSAKYYFVVAIESAIDIANHIISQNAYRAPEDYADTFQVLCERGAVDNEFVMSLKKMAKFRNRLIHLYWEVDDGQVYDILQTRVDDFNTFLKSISIFLNFKDLK